MLTFLLAFLYGYLYHKSALKRGSQHPKLWAVSGYLTFLIVTSATSWIITILYLSSQAGSFTYLSGSIKFLTGISIVLSALTVGNGVTLFIWKFFLSPHTAWSWPDAKTKVANTYSLSLSNEIPWFFVTLYIAVAFLGTVLVVLTQAYFLPDGNFKYPADRLAIDTLRIIGSAICYGIVLWKCKSWLTISLGWAVVSALSFSAAFMYQAHLSNFGVFIPSSLVLSQFVSAFIVIAVTALSVHKWGASPLVLLVSCFLSSIVVQIPLLFTAVPNATFHFIMSPLVWGTLMAVTFYFSLLAETTQTPSSTTD